MLHLGNSFSGLIQDSTGFMMLEVHAEVRLAS